MPLPYYVSPEQMMKDKAEYARKGIAARPVHRHPRISARASCWWPRTPPASCTRSPRSTTGSRFAGVGKYNEFENLRIAGIRHADVKGYSVQPGRRRRAKALANAYSQALGNIFTQDIKLLRGRGAGGRGGRRQRQQERDLPHPLRRHDRGREELRGHGRSSRGDPALPQGPLPERDEPGRRRCSSGSAPCRSPRTRRSPSATWRSPCWTAPRSDASSAASPRRSANSSARPSNPCYARLHNEVRRFSLRQESLL